MSREHRVKGFRAPDEELELIQEAIDRSGMSENSWFRAVFLAAAGHTELSDQLIRAEKVGKKLAK
jgi:hypothetical protein